MNASGSAPLGVIDWGIGGLSVARQLRVFSTQNRADSPQILYLSDTGVAPYGTLSKAALARRLHRAVDFLRERGAGRVLLACNAASTALAGTHRFENVTGVIDPAVRMIEKLRAKGIRRIAIIGGARTIRSRAHARALVPSGFQVSARIAQPLSALIERGAQETQAFALAAAKVLRGIENHDALLLACTHYPAALPVFTHIFKGRVLDPLDAIVKSIPREALRGRGPSQFLTTGDPRAMKIAAVHAWGKDLSAMNVTRVRIA